MNHREILERDYGLVLDGNWDENAIEAVYTATVLTAERLHRIYFTHNLTEYTVGQNPSLYPHELTAPQLFYATVDKFALQPIDDDGAIAAFGEVINHRTWRFGSKQLEKLESPEHWPAVFVKWVHNPVYNKTVDTWIFVMLAARLASDSVPDLPEDRIVATKQFYSPDGFGFGFAKQKGLRETLGYGRSQLDFTEWEVKRGVLNPLEREKQGSAWWRAVNGQIMRDMEEARILHAAQVPSDGSNGAVTRWLIYLKSPTPQNWYLAHDFSVTLGYMDYETLAQTELFEERALMADVMTRLMLAQTLITARQNDVLGKSVLDDLIEDVMAVVSEPEGDAVKLIVNVEAVYPKNYPLNYFDRINALFLYLFSAIIFRPSNTAKYAGVTVGSVLRQLANTILARKN